MIAVLEYQQVARRSDCRRTFHPGGPPWGAPPVRERPVCRGTGAVVHTPEVLLIGLSSIFVLGTIAQWLAWRLHLPSILLLLSFGYLAGPGLHALSPGSPYLQPDELFGELLFPIVNISIGVILFEGALGLRMAQLREIGRPLVMLLTVGAAISGMLAGLAARYLLGLEWAEAALLGALLVVTGPTVIGPLLRQIRPVGRVGPIARWEGIIIDPIGAILAVLVFEAILGSSGGGSLDQMTLHAAWSLLRTIAAGAGIGAATGVTLAVMLRRHLIPDYLQSPSALMLVLVALTVSDTFQEESGLLAVTVMGVVLANSRGVVMKQIYEFKESLSVILISSLFILLTARLEPAAVRELGWRGAAFVVCLLLIVRPVSVLASTWGSQLQWREKVFLSWLAPRGIVAASVASVFALRLGEAGFENAESTLTPATFVVVFVTVVTYGLTAYPLARRLGLATADPQGVLIAGANDFARAVAVALRELGFAVRVVDTNHELVKRARLDGIPATIANVLSEQAVENMDLGGIGRFLGLTANDEVNSLAALQFADLFGRSQVFQLKPQQRVVKDEAAAGHLRARFLFDDDVTSAALARRMSSGSIVKTTKLTDESDYDAFRRRYGESARLLFVCDGGRLTVVSTDQELTPRPGQTLVALVDDPLVNAGEQ
jgi:NhaP-type Na+/H+ or K+/H+ antiporter